MSLFPGKAIGPVWKQYCYECNSTARAVKIRTLDSKLLEVYYNGGCFFQNAEIFDDVEILGWYNDFNLPAIININNGSVILSGVHFEYEISNMNIIETSKESENLRKKLISHIFRLLGMNF